MEELSQTVSFGDMYNRLFGANLARVLSIFLDGVEVSLSRRAIHDKVRKMLENVLQSTNLNRPFLVEGQTFPSPIPSE